MWTCLYSILMVVFSGELAGTKCKKNSLLDVDDRFARDVDYLFVAQYNVEAK